MPVVAKVPNNVVDDVEPVKVKELDPVNVLENDQEPETVPVEFEPNVVQVRAPAVTVVNPPVLGLTLPIAVACIPASASNIPVVYTFPLMPTPPDTINAPVVGPVDTLPPLRFNAPSTIALPQILEFAFNCAISYTYLFKFLQVHR